MILTVIFSFSGVCAEEVSRAFSGNVSEAISGELVRRVCAAPWILWYDEKFYLTRTGTSRILVEETDRLDDFMSSKSQKTLAYDSAADRTVRELGYGGVNGTWSPESHHSTDDDFSGHTGWYLFLALRDSVTGDSVTFAVSCSNRLRTCLPNLTGAPLRENTRPCSRFWTERETWFRGQSALRIRDGEWKGIYGMFVTEKERGSSAFHQEIRIARMKTPWQLDSDFSVITIPTQHWETIGSGPSKSRPGVFLPKVVEGATAVYGDRGDVYVIYSGRGTGRTMVSVSSHGQAGTRSDRRVGKNTTAPPSSAREIRTENIFREWIFRGMGTHRFSRTRTEIGSLSFTPSRSTLRTRKKM